MSEQSLATTHQQAPVQTFRDRAPVVLQEFGMTLLELSGMAAKAGFFGKGLSPEQAMMKIAVGRELGMNPIQSLMNVDFFDGNISIRANWRATCMKGTHDGHVYDYKVHEHTAQICTVEIFRDGESIGTSSYAMEDAQRAGLAGKDVWKKNPLSMLFARAISNAQRWYCPELMGGMPVYDPDEISEVRAVERTDSRKALGAEIMHFAQAPAARQITATETVDMQTGEVLTVEVAGKSEELKVGMPSAMTASEWGEVNTRAESVFFDPDAAEQEANLQFNCSFAELHTKPYAVVDAWLTRMEERKAKYMSADEIVDPFAENGETLPGMTE